MAEWIAIDLQPGRAEAWWLDGAEVRARAGIAAPLTPPDATGAAPLVTALRGTLAAPARLPALIDGLRLPPPVAVPAKPATLPPYRLEGLQAEALPPLMQSKPATGLMTGAAARLAGFFALNPRWDGVVVLPGPVTHWVQVSAEEVVSFQSALSGTLARALMQGETFAPSELWDETEFFDALDTTLSRPERLASGLAALQAAVALGQVAPDRAPARLSGLLVGAELAAARPYWLGQQIAVMGSPAEARPYVAALGRQGVPCLQADPARMALAGFIALRRGKAGAA